MMPLLMLIMMLKFCVKESSNLIGLENLGAAGVFITAGQGQCSPNPPSLPYQIFTFTKILHYFYLKLEIKEQKQKMVIKIFQQQNKSIFLGNLYKTFCLWCTYLQDLVIHDHEDLLQAEKFQHPTKILEIPTVIASFC